MSIIKSDEEAAKYINQIIKECSRAEAKYVFSIRSRTLTQRTTLHVLCMNGYVNSVKVLLDSRLVDINVTDYQDATPLHLACYYQQFEVTELLISYGAKIHNNLVSFITPSLQEISIRGKKIYNEITGRTDEDDEYTAASLPTKSSVVSLRGDYPVLQAAAIEKYNLCQKYVACRENYSRLAKQILSQTVNENNMSSMYFSTINRPIGTGRPLSSSRDNQVVTFLEIA